MPDNIIPDHPFTQPKPPLPALPPLTAEAAGELFLRFMRTHGFPEIALQPTAAIKALTGGTCSTNWRITTNAGAFVMSIADKPMQRMNPKDVRHFEQYLWKHNVSLAEPIGPIGFVQEGHPTYFQINRFVRGVPFDDLPNRELNPTQLSILGEELAKTHIWGERFHDKFPYELTRVSTADRAKFIYENRENDTCKSLHLMQGTVAAVGHNIARTAKSVVRKATGKHAPLPKGILHGDFNHTNVLFDGNTPLLIDWANAHYGICAEEIAKALVEFVILPEAQKTGIADHAQVIEKTRSFLLGYNGYRQLTKEERQELPNQIAAIAVATAFRPIIGQGGRYAKGPLPQGALLQNAVHSLCTDPKFGQMLEQLSYQRSRHACTDAWLGGGL